MSNVNEVRLADMWPFMQEQIAMGKKVRFGPKGRSMLPMIREGLDTVVLVKAPEKLKKYDLPLYRRKNGQFVIHRVIGVGKNGYTMRGDNQCNRERGVENKDILALVEGFYREKEYVSCNDKKYRKYCVKQVRKQNINEQIAFFRAVIAHFFKKVQKK